MVKPKKPRKGDSVQVAHSVFADVIKLTEKAGKSIPNRPRKPRRK